MYDLLIQNVRLIDGTGAPWTWGSLAVRDGKIAAVGAVEGPAREVVDGEGACLAPGFIDIHSHSDGALLRCPTAESRIHLLPEGEGNFFVTSSAAAFCPAGGRRGRCR